MALNVMTGNRALVKLGGETIGAGLINNINVSDDFGLQDIDGLGEAESVELVVGKVSHTISMSKFFVSNKKLRELGYVPESKDYLTSGEIEIEVIDRLGDTQELYSGCKAASTGRSYGKHAPSTEDITFRALHKIK